MELHFKRPDVATESATLVLKAGLFTSSTLFLGAPRRTGKSTFLIEELTPALEKLDALVLYVDLWKNPSTDPGELIANTIASALAKAQGAVARAAQAVGLSKVSIHGVEFNLGDIGSKPGASLADALKSLIEKVERPVVLIVDEAQHAITSKEGMNAMFALKSARDTINSPGVTRLGLVMSGSDRDKLLRLVHGNSTPFLGSTINELPLLGDPYMDFLAGHLRVAKPALAIDNQRLYETFVRFDHRPEEIQNAITRVAGPFSRLTDDNFHDLLDIQAHHYEQDRAADYANAYESLSALERAILTRVLSHGKEGKLFTGDALKEYTEAHGKLVQAGTAQAATEKLRNREPPLIWKSARGDYAPEDSGMRTWYERLEREGRWPPVDQDAAST
ncbi:ATP-binding protein [Luteibacter sp. ME-Dv--P-043b]|jgi:hypothetical protein|uniref:ATP-binding protein n=1 Tax=unclassified Luteibacter TaxID=2620188 RepID=UPI0025557240|nr:ATP-binding protein [Luteibacter sp. ME-Dv--P-043b]